MKFQEKRDLEVAPALVVGDRSVFVVCERLLISIAKDRLIFGMLISPIYIIIIEHDISYAFSLLEGIEVKLEELYLRNSSLKEKLYRIRNQFGKGLELEFSNNDEPIEF
jgi:hypothetical protein